MTDDEVFSDVRETLRTRGLEAARNRQNDLVRSLMVEAGPDDVIPLMGLFRARRLLDRYKAEIN